MFEGAMAGTLRGLVRCDCVASTRLLQGGLATTGAVSEQAETPLSEAMRQKTPSQSVARAGNAQKGYRPAIGSVEVCTPQASHDPRKLLKGPNVGRRDTPISVVLLADYREFEFDVQWVSIE